MLDSKKAICQTLSKNLLLEKAFFSHNFSPLHFTSFLHHLCCQSEIIKLRADPHLSLSFLTLGKCKLLSYEGKTSEEKVKRSLKKNKKKTSIALFCGGSDAHNSGVNPGAHPPHHIRRACPLPVVLPYKAQGQRGSGPLVTSANCPDGPASSVLLNTSCSVGVYRQGAHWQLPPSRFRFHPRWTIYTPPPITGPLRSPHYVMRSHQCEQWKTISDNVGLKIGLLTKLWG